MDTANAIAEGRVATCASWQEYRNLVETLGERGVRITYDRGRLEFMSPSRLHERVKSLLGQLVGVLLEELAVDAVAGGSTTFFREQLERGLEPDQCYWIRSFSLVAEEVEAGPAEEPAPDLVIEVDITRSSIDRMGIYRALGVSEVWRYSRREGLVFLRLSPGGHYESVERSPTFPGLPSSEVNRHVEMGLKGSLTAVLKSFRGWVRENVGD